MVNQHPPTPEELIKSDLERLSDASARLMMTLANVKPGFPLPEDFPLSNLIHSLQESQERIDREIQKAGMTFFRQTLKLEWLGKR